MLSVGVLVLDLAHFFWSVSLLIMAKSPSSVSPSIPPHRFLLQLLSPITASFQPIPSLSILMSLCFSTTKPSMTSAGGPLSKDPFHALLLRPRHFGWESIPWADWFLKKTDAFSLFKPVMHISSVWTESYELTEIADAEYTCHFCGLSDPPITKAMLPCPSFLK